MTEMVYVNSTNIEQLGYENDASELSVIFKNNPVRYVYLNVPSQVYQDLINAVSIGSFFNREIKDIYSFEKR